MPPVIVIDPGHGGAQAAGKSTPIGEVGPGGTTEKDVALRVASSVARQLPEFDVRLTRSDDWNLSLAARAALARESGAAAFVSVHANAGPPGERGTETWVHDQATPTSWALARALQGELVGLTGVDRGVHSGALAVLAPTHVGSGPACLVEVDFLSHPERERAFREPSTIDAIGAALARALRQHVGALGARGLSTIDVQHDVQLVPQNAQMGCWAASVSMVVGTRDQMSIDPGTIADRTGMRPELQNGLSDAQARTVGDAFGLVFEPDQSWTVEGFAELVRQRGPLWVSTGPGNGASVHDICVTGIRGDGTPDGTIVLINDPWPPGAGNVRTQTYRQFVADYEPRANGTYLIGHKAPLLGTRAPIGNRGPFARASAYIDFAPGTNADAIAFYQQKQRDAESFVAGVPDATVRSIYPHTAICKLRVSGRNESGNPLTWGGTGWFISSGRVITAAHVLCGNDPRMNGRYYAQTVEVLPGFYPGGGSSITVDSAMQVHPNWRWGAGGAQWDLGILDATSSGSPGWFDLQELDFNPASGILVCGYAGGGFESHMLQQSVQLDGQRQRLSLDTIHELPAGVLAYRAQSTVGTSGGVVFYVDDAGEVRAVGIHSRSAGSYNHACALDTGKIRWARTTTLGGGSWPPVLAGRYGNPQWREVPGPGNLQPRYRNDQNLGRTTYDHHLNRGLDYQNNLIFVFWAQGGVISADFELQLYDADPGNNPNATPIATVQRRLDLPDGSRVGFEFTQVNSYDRIFYRILPLVDYSQNPDYGRFAYFNVYG